MHRPQGAAQQQTAHFSLDTDARADACTLHVRGELERAALYPLIESLRAAEEAGAGALTIDLGECESLDPLAVCVLMDAGRRARRDGREFSLAPESPKSNVAGIPGQINTPDSGLLATLKVATLQRLKRTKPA